MADTAVIQAVDRAKQKLRVSIEQVRAFGSALADCKAIGLLTPGTADGATAALAKVVAELEQGLRDLR